MEHILHIFISIRYSNCKMKIKLFFLIFLILGSAKIIHSFPLIQNFDKAVFYHVMKSGGIDEIDDQLSIINSSSIKEKEAYEGALLMRKAGVVKKAKEKLRLFKSGRIKLETAIHLDNDNVEYHFLRLMIQEHAPKVTKYHGQIKEDSRYIRENFKKLPEVVQKVVIDYSKTSKILQPVDF